MKKSRSSIAASTACQRAEVKNKFNYDQKKWEDEIAHKQAL